MRTFRALVLGLVGCSGGPMAPTTAGDTDGGGHTDVAVDTDPTDVDTDPTDVDTDPAVVDTDPTVLDSDTTVADTDTVDTDPSPVVGADDSDCSESVDTDPIIVGDLWCAGAVVLPPPPRLDCDLDCRLDQLRAFDDVHHACADRRGTCTDALGRDLVRLHHRVVCKDPYSWYDVTHEQTAWYDAATGAAVAIRAQWSSQDPAEQPEDDWTGAPVTGCTPSAEVDAGCDTGDFCDTVAELEPVYRSCDDPCAAWPGGTGSLARLSVDAEFNSYVGGLRGAGDLTGDGVDDLLAVGLGVVGSRVAQTALFAGGPGVLERHLDVRVATTVIQPEPGGTIWSAVAGDFDGDGVTDLAASDANGGPAGAAWGRVWVFKGPIPPGPVLDVAQATWTVRGTSRLPELGRALVNGGDLDGDGDDDIVATSAYYSFDWEHVLHLDAAQTGVFDVDHVATSFAAGEVARAVPLGDLNGDGVDDLAIVVPGSRGGANTPDPVRLLPGPIGGAAAPEVVLRPEHINDVLDLLVAADLDHDGEQDLILRSFVGDGMVLWHVEGWPAEGFVSAAAVARITGPAPLEMWDWEVGPLGDVASIGDRDGDGVDDLAVGVPWAGAERTCRQEVGTWFSSPALIGSAQGGVVFLSGAALDADGDLDALGGGMLIGTRRYSRDGQHLTAIGDVDGDGGPDVIVGEALDLRYRLPSCP